MFGSGWCGRQVIPVRRRILELWARRDDYSKHVSEADGKTWTRQQEEWTGTQEGRTGGAQGHREGPQEPASGWRWSGGVCQFLQSAAGPGAPAERSPRRWVRATKKQNKIVRSTCALFPSVLTTAITDTATRVSLIWLSTERFKMETAVLSRGKTWF